MKNRLFVFIFFSMILTESTVACSQNLTDVVKLIRHLSYEPTELPFTERNIYLDKVVIWNPGLMGISWWGNSSLCDAQGIPINNGLALGPPTGTGAGSRGRLYSSRH